MNKQFWALSTMVLAWVLFIVTPAFADQISSVIQRVGLIGDEFRPAGVWSTLRGVSDYVNENGQVIGLSEKFNTLGQYVGHESWIDDGSGAIRLGLYGDGYQHNNGTEYSFIMQMNKQGQVVGFSSRYLGHNSLGQAAWIDDGNGARRLGFFGEGFQRDDGYENSTPWRIDDYGQVLGQSIRYIGSTEMGNVAWVDDGNGARRVGYYGDGYQRNDGYHHSWTTTVNALGQVVGSSYRYGDDLHLGQAAWIADDQGTRRLGFFGDEYQRSDGFESSSVTSINNQGRTTGNSIRFNGTDQVGRTAWIDHGSGPIRQGLTGGIYQSSDGLKHTSILTAINQRGQIAGANEIFSGSKMIGNAAWFDDGSGARRVGLYGDGYRRASDGYEFSRATSLNNQGQLLGFSRRYQEDEYLGRAYWIDNGNGPIRVGLRGGVYTSSNGHEDTYALYQNDSGQVAGNSVRYSGDSQLGNSSWYYDPVTDSYSELVFSIRDDGYTYTSISRFFEDGTVIGTYKRFDGSTELGYSIFAWNIDYGMIELSESALSTDGLVWSESLSLAGAEKNEETIYVTGLGKVEGETRNSIFLLTATIPEPASIALLALGAPLLMRRSRR